LPAGQILRLPANANRSLRYDNPTNSKEHFYVEARRLKGRGTKLPDEGLMVWHIDENGDNAYWQTSAVRHYKVSLEQADGKADLENGRATGPGDLFHANYADAFGPSTKPNSNWWSGAVSAFRLTSIGAVADTMSLVWSGGASLPLWPAATATGSKPGLNVAYLEGTWTGLPVVTMSNILKRGTATAIGPAFAGGKATNYALAYDGFFAAPTTGVYTFTATADGAARIWLDTLLQVDLVAGGAKTFSVNLAQGAHVFRAVYAHGVSGAPTFALAVSGGNLASGTVPASVWINDGTGVYASDAAPVSYASRGLRYAYYEGAWTAQPTFAGLKPVRTGLASALTATGAGATRAKDWGVVYKGWIKVDKLGNYLFTLASGDGSRISLDGAPAVDNSGSHASKAVSAAWRLWPGYHSIQIEYYQHAYPAGLDVKLAALGGAAANLPLSMLFNDSAKGLSPQGAPGDGRIAGWSTIETENVISVRLRGNAMDVAVPPGYQGPVQLDLVDLQGRVENTISAFSEGDGESLRLSIPNGSRLAVVRLRLSDRTLSRVVSVAR
jgi:hypothetical protein